MLVRVLGLQGGVHTLRLPCSVCSLCSRHHLLTTYYYLQLGVNAQLLLLRHHLGMARVRVRVRVTVGVRVRGRVRVRVRAWARARARVR
eukprot:scaffold44970_cov27-Phaeocystis_antarctica.AAC.1